MCYGIRPIVKIARSNFPFTIYVAAITAASLAMVAAARRQKSYDPGASDTEIKIGNIMSYTGYGAAYGAIARAEAAYFQMVNERGGVNGRKITFVSVDNGSEATRSLELARKLVNEDKVLLIFGAMGTETNLAIRGFMNENKVPQLFLDSSSSVFNDPVDFPWTMGFYATLRTEGSVYANYVLQNNQNAKIAVLYADDDAGKEYLAGVHDVLGTRAATMIVKELPYEISSPEIEALVGQLKDSGADVFFNFCTGAFATRAIRAAYDAGWKPMQFIPNASLSVAAFLEPAGLEKASGVISNARSKGWLRPSEQSDPDVRAFVDWMKKYNSQANLRDQNNVAGYERAEALVEVLRRCGDNLTRANVMKQAANLDIEIGMLRPGIRVKTSPDDYQPIRQLFLVRFDGRAWQALTPVVSN
jgi:branched-chain amino acid transport system substrate-binding protein